MKNLIIILAVMSFTFMTANNSFAQNQYNQEVNNDGKWFKVEKPLILGSNTNRRPIEVILNSGDKGKTFGGKVKYAQKEGMLAIKLTKTNDCNSDGVCTYSAFTKKGNADWISDGIWKMQSIYYQILTIDAKSSDDGKNLSGSFTVRVDDTQTQTYKFKATVK